MISVIGENVIDIFPEPDGRLRAREGGSPLNFAIACAAQRVPVCYLSPLSADGFGDNFRALLAQKQISAGYPQASALPSSLALVRLDAQGHPSYSLYRQGIADRDYDTETLIKALPADCRILHTGSLALEPQDAARLLPVLQHAKSLGIKLSIDINVRLQFVSDAAAYLQHIMTVLPLADYIKASDEDLAALWPALSLADAINQLQQRAPTALLALTYGGDGAELRLGTASLRQAVIPPSPFVDTVGAGDTFFANLLVQLLALDTPEQPLQALLSQDAPLRSLAGPLRRACLAASLNISRQGCVPPDKAELDAALAALDA